jgi:hypothetical protein
MHLCASTTISLCFLNFGTKRRDILSTSESAGINLPKS